MNIIIQFTIELISDEQNYTTIHISLRCLKMSILSQSTLKMKVLLHFKYNSCITIKLLFSLVR